ncbi:AAA family ATPase [Leptolyngbya cf. ectocarpi LEGE 11479]|uniref:Gluconokinase n=1 Tax=Leptolyngbya cf. ectocarpi LEGE 11479 TaxID=1828722 RepID=A0A928ZZ45_LEPEC|nr:gluconokinase, GntK/IdnK-type [Leptolyngbya ectocarpi]MBE9070172.1 AAA family ATPase [Leptolyngbya cf. ectocarpi LEGE 11479]
MNDCPLVWVIMGVAGAGKTVVGRLLSERLESDFLEGDRRHSLSNIIKMQSRIALEDKDRHQWLLEIEDDMQQAIDKNRETVLTCSALKASYRKQLASFERVQLVWLNVPQADLERRLLRRANHYMKPEMLASQLAAFEPISPEENVITIDGRLLPAKIVDELLNQATWLFPDLEKPWWQRTGRN